MLGLPFFLLKKASGTESWMFLCSESQSVGVGGTDLLFWLQSEPWSSLIQLLPVDGDQWWDCNLFSCFLGTGTVAD